MKKMSFRLSDVGHVASTVIICRNCRVCSNAPAFSLPHQGTRWRPGRTFNSHLRSGLTIQRGIHIVCSVVSYSVWSRGDSYFIYLIVTVIPVNSTAYARAVLVPQGSWYGSTSESPSGQTRLLFVRI
jgi:hypothetical protein